MGKRDRERVQAIREGKVPSIRAQGDLLRFELVKEAGIRMFSDQSLDTEPIRAYTNNIIKYALDSLPTALNAIKANTFHLDDISHDKVINEIGGRSLAGTLSRAESIFKFTHKGEYWDIKKRGGRTRTGKWKFCEWCGSPIYVVPSRNTRFHTRECYWKSRRGERGRFDGDQKLLQPA